MNLATFIPAFRSLSSISTDLDAGPKVHTILVFGLIPVEACCTILRRSSTDRTLGSKTKRRGGEESSDRAGRNRDRLGNAEKADGAQSKPGQLCLPALYTPGPRCTSPAEKNNLVSASPWLVDAPEQAGRRIKEYSLTSCCQPTRLPAY